MLLRKEKRHTLKTQMLINHENEEITSLAFEKGKVHDFQLFRSCTNSPDVHIETQKDVKNKDLQVIKFRKIRLFISVSFDFFTMNRQVFCAFFVDMFYFL